MIFPTSIQFYPTLRCNQECSFCFNRHITDRRLFSELDSTGAYALASLFIEIGISEVDILGGEPLLVPWLPDFTLRLLDSGITVNISTNGSLPHMVGQFSDISSPLFNFGFSVHGFHETHSILTSSDHFETTVSCIKMMIDAGRNPITKSALTPKNRGEISGLVGFLKRLGVSRYYLLHEDTIGRETSLGGLSFPEFWAEYSRLKAAWDKEIFIGFVAASGFCKASRNSGCRCDAGVHKLAVFPDGSVFPCNLFGGFPEYNMGNIFHKSTQTILAHPLLVSLRNAGAKNPCPSYDCAHFSYCRGGCPAHSYERYGSLHAPDPRCKRD